MGMRNEKGQFVKGHHWRRRKPWWDKAWLDEQYSRGLRSAADIAQEYGVTENAILYWLAKHGIPRRSMAEIRERKHWGASGVDNPMWNKRGELNPNWKGGVTAERQGFYISMEWKSACRSVWRRDNATCRRCGLHREESGDMPFHIHHIVSFADTELRAETDNLVLLCETCHHFVHSKENTKREYLPQV